MANDLNRCEFIGRLGSDVEVRYIPNGDPVANFNIAVNEQWRDKNSGEKQERVTWVRIVAWRRLAEVCNQYLSKGSRVFVAGKLTIRKWQDNNGQDRYTTEIVANEMQMLDSKGGGEHSGGNNNQASQGNSSPPASSHDDFDDDIPF